MFDDFIIRAFAAGIGLALITGPHLDVLLFGGDYLILVTQSPTLHC